MELNYFSMLCFIWAFIGILSRILIRRLGSAWKDWEENKAYTDVRPKWLIAVDVLAVSVIALTWYMVIISDVRYSWISASLLTLVLLKAVVQLFQYDQFKAFVKKAMLDDKLFLKINTGVMIFSICLTGLGVFYAM